MVMGILCLLGVFASMYIIWRACDGFEAATSFLGRRMSEGVRGATLNAIGSSMPEFLTTCVALLLLHDSDGFAFGIATTTGSDIFNSAVIPGLVILFVTLTRLAPMITISKKVAFRDGLILIGGELLLIAILGKGELTWLHGLTLVSYYAVYMVLLLAGSPRDKSAMVKLKVERKDGTERFTSLLKLDLEGVIAPRRNASATVLLVLSTTVIGLACTLLVHSCYGIGDALSIRTYFVAVILAAAATSVPDTFISIKDALTGEYDDAVSNALGSNVFDICICLGVPLVVFCLLTGGPLSVSVANQAQVAELRVFLLGHTCIIFGMFLVGRGMAIGKGLAMIALYASFVAFVIGRAFEHTWAVNLGSTLKGFLDGVVVPY